MNFSSLLIEKFENIGLDETGSEEKAIVINNFNWLQFWIFIASLVWSIMLFLIGQSRASIFPLIAAVIVPLNLLVFHKTKNFNIAINTFLIVILVLPAFVQLFNGGFINSGAVISWCAMAPIAALAFKPASQAVRCFGLFIVIIITTMTIELYELPSYNQLSEKAIKFQFLMNLAGVVSTCFFPLLTFAKELKSSRKIIKRTNSTIVRSINYAKYIQTATLLPTKEFNSIFNDKSFILFKPKEVVSGDFYWAYKDGDESIAVCADCTGHGVPGSFMTMIGINHLSSIIRENKENDPAKILTLLHQRVISSLKNAQEDVNDGIELTICKINYKTKEIIYASAMSKIFFFNGNNVTKYRSDKFNIGDSKRTVEYTNRKIKFKSGNILYLTTDGFLDQFGGPDNKKYGSRKFLSTLEKCSILPFQDQKKNLSARFARWQAEQDQVDDVTILGIQL